MSMTKIDLTQEEKCQELIGDGIFSAARIIQALNNRTIALEALEEDLNELIETIDEYINFVGMGK